MYKYMYFSMYLYHSNCMLSSIYLVSECSVCTKSAMDPSKQEAIANLEIEMMTDLYNRCANVC